MSMRLLNEHAWRLCDEALADADKLGIADQFLACGTQIVDCGIHAPGSIEAGRRLAEICMSGGGMVEITPCKPDVWQGSAVQVRTANPIAACMASQYAGWEIKGDGFFAMASGPMRAAAGREELFDTIGHRETANRCVGVLETDKLPPESVCLDISAKCAIAADRLRLLIARTESPAGTVQIVARSIETAMHKLHLLDFDLNAIERGFGTAPLPPIADKHLAAIGRTNDAILYGGYVELVVSCDDATLEEIGPRVPSSASPDFGRPFADVFSRYNGDFYRIDPMLFSPAIVVFINQQTGKRHEFGRSAPSVLNESFGNT